jgi:hypothetical protein
MKITKTICLLLDRYPVLVGYFLASYLFWLPWLPFWRSSFADDPGIVLFVATWMVILSPLVMPVVIALMGLVFFSQTYEKNLLMAMGTMLLPFAYYAFVLVISVLIIRWLSRRLNKNIKTCLT